MSCHAERSPEGTLATGASAGESLLLVVSEILRGVYPELVEGLRMTLTLIFSCNLFVDPDASLAFGHHAERIAMKTRTSISFFGRFADIPHAGRRAQGPALDFFHIEIFSGQPEQGLFECANSPPTHGQVCGFPGTEWALH